MFKSKKIPMAIMLGALFSVAGCSNASLVPQVQATPAFNAVDIQYERFTLANGLTVLVHTDHSVPNVFVGVWYKVGSKNEAEGKTGFAHLFEHLMFQDTIHRQGEYFVPLEQVGAVDINGTTNMDRTNFYQTVPSNAIDVALWMESDRMAYLGDSVDQRFLDEQRAVVKNEKRQGQLRPGANVYERFLENFYPQGHPYDHSTIGSMADLDNATLQDVTDWYEQAYGASNAVLVLSGDIDLETARQKVSYYFGDVPAGEPMDKIEQWIPELTSVKKDVIYDKVPTVNLSRIWPLPNNNSQDTTIMELVARSLAGGKNTPLYDLLVDENDIALGVRAHVQANDVSSTFSLDIALKPDADIKLANQLIDDGLAEYFRRGPGQEKLDGIGLAGEIALLRSMQSNQAIGTHLIDGEVHHNNPLFLNKQRSWIHEATPEQVRKTAQKWLGKPYYDIQLLPQPDVKDIKAKVDRTTIPSAGEFTGKVSLREIQTAMLDNGLKIVVARRDNLPLVDVSMQFSTGSLVDNQYAPDTASNAFRLMTTGTEQYSMAELSRKLDALGMQFNSGAGTRESGVSWNGLSENLDATFALAAHIIRHPAYPEAEVRKVLQNIDTAHEAYEQNPMQAASEVYSKAIWGSTHPFGKITSREEAKTLSREMIQSFYEHEVGPEGATLYLVGDVTLETAEKLANAYFADWRKSSRTKVPEIAPPVSQTGKVILIDAPGAVQSSISAGHIVGKFNQDSSAIESLMDAVLGAGFNSRLNMNLREDKGWAYGFRGGINNAPDRPRVFTASGTVQADKTAASMLEIQKEISAYISDKPVSPAELERVRDAAVYSIPQGFNSNGAILKTLINADLYHLPYRRVETAAERLLAVTADQITSLANKTYRPDDLVWVVVGDLKKIEQDIRDTHLGDVEVWDVYGNKLR
ncbi:M16 family metallopeptidase [Alteromonas gilva]|uniref:Pitrilysin family protein n=1 Tax=Alteromonas gilva TaxID=2987522 RepID=A0ABT5L1E5_9ALTE|nr:pitrilysin family protein [Alteromonas gilva]MDC8830229.1 pitrilysin family protein [Alteromonas gilva]